MAQIIVIIFILLCGGVAQGEEITGSISSGVNSVFLVKPGFVVYNRPIWWSNIHLEYDGWYVNGFGSLATESKRETFGDEFDGTLGKKFSIAGCKIDLSGSYFVFSKFGDHTDDLWILDGRADFPDKVPFVNPWVAVRYFGSVGKKSPQSGWFGWVGAQRSQPLGFILPTQKDEFALNLDGSIAFSAGGAFRGEAGPVYARLNASTDLFFGEKTFVSPWVLWQIPFQDRGRYVDGNQHVVYGISITRLF